MDDQYNRFELLAIALYPRFGNIYEYNVANNGDVGYDIQIWTDELRDAVRQYLRHDLPAEVTDRLLSSDEGAVDATNKAARVDSLLEVEPWEIALEVCNAAIVVVPSLYQLIGDLDDWPSEEERDMTIVWLEAHSNIDTWNELAIASRYDVLRRTRMPSGATGQVLPDDLVQVLTPAELVAAWECVVGPAESDLTDEEWQLLEPHFGPVNGPSGMRPRSSYELRRKRRAFDAIRFKMAHDVPWTRLPSRYAPSSTYQMYRHYNADGLFSRLYEALRGNPDAGRIVEWLEQIVNDGGSAKPATSTEAIA
ncbi:transposase [Nocardia sp. CA-107356]|uniref:transposase n=1 Tax=Nocardia sp. CA-107356 TaxID=3239972 RepID=UPI003D91D389